MATSPEEYRGPGRPPKARHEKLVWVTGLYLEEEVRAKFLHECHEKELEPSVYLRLILTAYYMAEPQPDVQKGKARKPGKSIPRPSG